VKNTTRRVITPRKQTTTTTSAMINTFNETASFLRN
jgi:hypothetical protein